MAVVIPPGFAQASVEHWLTGYNRPAVTTWGVQVLGTPAGGPTEMAQRFQDAYITAFAARTDSNVRIRSTRLVIGQDAAEPLVGVADNGAVGASSRSSTAPALALMVTKQTGLGGRRNRGRVYFPWAVSDDAVAENGAVNDVTLNAWDGSLASFLGLLDVDSYFGDLHVLHGPFLGPPTPVTGLQANPTIRTQKQRQVRY